jgi:hypothetical protein
MTVPKDRRRMIRLAASARLGIFRSLIFCVCDRKTLNRVQ